MSEPIAVAEKAVWLDDHLVKFFTTSSQFHGRHRANDLIKEVVNIILSRMTPTAVDELYDHMIAIKEIDGMSEDELDKSLKDANVDPASVMERVEKMVTRDEASTVVESVVNGLTQAYIAGMKAQKAYDS